MKFLYKLIFIFFIAKSAFATNGNLFNVNSSGYAGNVSVTLCLNGKGPMSCEDFIVSALNLSIRTTVNRTYPSAGIRVNNSEYKIGGIGRECSQNANGYCLFSVDNTRPKTITIATTGPLIILPSSLSSATYNTAYSQTVTAHKGVAPYTYAVTSGLLPDGLSLDATTGVISGTPTTLNTYSFTITATDVNSDSGSKDYSIVVSGDLPISPSSLPDGTADNAYSQTVTASNGVPPYTYAVSAGSLPTGLSLDASTGVISGTPTTASTYAFTITATDANSNTGSKAYSVMITSVFPIVFSQNFVFEEAPIAQSLVWNSFRASLPSSGISSISFGGSLAAIPKVCNNAVIAQQIADALRTATSSQFICDDNTWAIGRSCVNSGAVELLVLPSDPVTCGCYTNPDVFTLRPNAIGINWGWGGIGTSCYSPSQTLTLTVS